MAWTHRVAASHPASGGCGIDTWDSYAPSAGSYSGTATWPGACNVINYAGLVAFKGAAGAFSTPAYVQGAGSASPFVGASFHTWTQAFANPNVAGNCIVVDVTFGSSFPISGVTITDSQGNVYTQIFGTHTAGAATFLFSFIAANCAAGPNTITVTQNSLEDFQSIAVAIHEYAGLSGAWDATSNSSAPATNSLTETVAVTIPTDLLHFIAASLPFCGGVVASLGGSIPLPGPPPPAATQRGNIDYDQVRASVRSGPGGKFVMLGAGAAGPAGAGLVWDGLGNATTGSAAAAVPTAAKYSTSWTAQTSVVVTHNLGTRIVLVQAFDAAGNVVIPQKIAITSANVVTLTFGAAFTGSAVVIGFLAGLPAQEYSMSWTAQTSVVVTHNLGTLTVLAQVYDAAGAQVDPQKIAITSANVVTLTFGAAFTGTVIIIGLAILVRQVNQAWTAQTSVTVTHDLATLAVIVQVYDGAGNQATPALVTATDANTVTLIFGAAFTGSVSVLG